MAAVENIVREALSGDLSRQLGTSAPMMPQLVQTCATR